MRRTARLARVVPWLPVLGLIALHGLRPAREGLLLGWPPELLFRLAWIVCAWLALRFLFARVWPREEA